MDITFEQLQTNYDQAMIELQQLEEKFNLLCQYLGENTAYGIVECPYTGKIHNCEDWKCEDCWKKIAKGLKTDHTPLKSVTIDGKIQLYESKELEYVGDKG